MSVPDPSDLNAAGASVSALEALERAAEEAGLPAIAEEARAVAARVDEGLFYVVCLGEFKRGKSTLLNALVGREILPTGVIPVTSAVTILRYGPAERARVRVSGGGIRQIELSEIPDFVTEDGNPENRRGLLVAEILVPSPLLATGMCLVDTPGIGSVFAANTAATRAFLPHVDAALVVIGADPPLSGDELTLAEEAAREARHLVFVLNKADRLPDSECAEASRFAERILASRLKRPVSLLSVSAAERLRGDGPARQWEALVRSLEALAREAGADLVRAAAARTVRRLSQRLVHGIEEQRGALIRPLDESEKRIEELEATLAEAERALADLGHLLAAEEARLAAHLRSDRDEFLARELPRAREELRRIFVAAPEVPALRELMAEASRTTAKRTLDAWADAERPDAEALYRQGADRFIEMGNRFLARFLGSGGPELDGQDLLPDPERGFRGRPRFQFTELLAAAEQAPFSRVVDRLRSRSSVREAAGRDAGDYLERLLASNSARVQNDLIELVAESRRRLETEVRERLSQTVRSASAALDRARVRRAEGDASVRAHVERLDALRWRVEALRIDGS